MTVKKTKGGQKRIKALMLVAKGITSIKEPACVLEPGCELSNRILVGTHHKTGTVWLKSIFNSICHYHSLIFYVGKQENLPVNFDVFLEGHSRFDFESIEFPDRGIHIIRDPRDIILSGAFYHQKSNENWLHYPREKLNGLTYQQKINSYKNLDDKILFEMEHAGRNTITAMQRWNYANPYFHEVKYEELIDDVNLTLFHNLFCFLGFPGSIPPSLLAISYKNSLFSGIHHKSIHIRSGKKNQWRNYFKGFHNDRFLELFGDVLLQLGYEADDNWADSPKTS
jgi:hypothetical protein